MEEIWKDIPGYEGMYQASTFGNIRECATQRILPQYSHETKGGKYYLRCGFSHVCHIVHRLIAVTFIANPENKRYVDHIDFNEQNNHVENLRWVTAKENTAHSVDDGRIYLKSGMTGNSHPKSKFTEVEVREMKRMRSMGIRYKKIAALFNTSENTICAIITRNYYK